MHFWINKSQGCGFNGRYVPPSISAGSRSNFLCGGLHPKPMVTPVHRFQSIESVASAGHRHHPNTTSRGPSYHTRFPVPSSSSHLRNNENNVSTGHNSRSGGNQRHQRILIEYMSPNSSHHHHHHHHQQYHQSSLTRINSISSPAAKLKCGVWTIIGLVPFLIAAAKYYINGAYVGIEALMFFAVLVFILVIIGIVSLFEAFNQKRDDSPSVTRESVQITSEQNETFEETSSVHNNPLVSSPSSSINFHHSPLNAAESELPPPPYHIAVMLPTHPPNRIIQDSPPPTYDKAIT